MLYKKKDSAVKAIQWTGKNIFKVKSFVEDNGGHMFYEYPSGELHLPTGIVEKGDFLISEEFGRVHVKKEGVFKAEYEKAEPKDKRRVIKG